MKIPFNLRLFLFGILPFFVASYFLLVSLSPKGFPDSETQFSYYQRHELHLEATSLAFEKLKGDFDNISLHRQFLNYYVLLDERKRNLLRDEVEEVIGIPIEYYEKKLSSDDPNEAAIGYYGFWKLKLRLENRTTTFDQFFKSDSSGFIIPFMNELKGDYWLKRDAAEATSFFYQEWKSGTNDLFLKRKLAVAAFESNSTEIFAEIIQEDEVKNDPAMFSYIRSFLFKTDKPAWLRSIPHQFFKVDDPVVVLNAMIIFSVWVVFLLYIDRFKDARFGYNLVSLIIAVVAIPLVITMYDTWYFTRDVNYEENIFRENFITGLFEELVKFIFPLLLVLIFGKKLNAPYAVLILFAFSALVFSAFENMLYFGNYRDLSIVSLRGLYSVTLHLCAGTIAAYGLVRWKFSGKSFLWIPFTFLIGVLIHALYDIIASSFVFYLNIPLVIISLFAMVSMVNNALNNSPRFDHTQEAQLNNAGSIIMIGFSLVLMTEFASTSLRYGAVVGNATFFNSLFSYGWLILVFASPVSNFKLVKAKWSFIDLGGMKPLEGSAHDVKEIMVTPTTMNASSYRLKILGTVRASSEKKWFHCIQEETGEYYLISFKEEGDHLIDHKIVLFILKAEKEIPHAFNPKSYAYLGMVFSSPVINS